MTNEALAYYLRGIFEIADLTAITDEQAQIIRLRVGAVRVHDPMAAFAKEVDEVLRDVVCPESRAAILRAVVGRVFWNLR